LQTPQFSTEIYMIFGQLFSFTSTITLILIAFEKIFHMSQILTE